VTERGIQLPSGVSFWEGGKRKKWRSEEMRKRGERVHTVRM